MTSQRRGRPPKISRADVVAAATSLADEQGLSAVTLRAVAARLGVAPMTIYGHVANAEELIDLVVGASVAAAVAASRADPAGHRRDGRTALVAFAGGFRDLLLQHPAVLEAYRRSPVQDQTGLAVTERIVASLVADGLDHDAAIEAYAAVYAYVVGFVSLEARPPDLDLDVLAGHPALERSRDRIATLFDQTSFDHGLNALVAGLLPH